jgi:outer membrane lipoprotein-sorting protein
MSLSRRRFLAIATGLPVALCVARARTALADATPQTVASELDRAIASIARARASLRTLTGPFVQERTIGLLASKVRSTGTLTLVRPDRLRWELAAPDSVVYWVTPEGLAYKSTRGEGRVGAGQARIAAALDDLRTVLGGDLDHLRARYDLRLVGDLAFEAIPRAPSPAQLQRILFAVAADRISPTRVELVEGPRDRTVITFGALQRDTTVDAARMRPPV